MAGPFVRWAVSLPLEGRSAEGVVFQTEEDRFDRSRLSLSFTFWPRGAMFVRPTSVGAIFAHDLTGEKKERTGEGQEDGMRE